jgi:hypothetical protein
MTLPQHDAFIIEAYSNKKDDTTPNYRATCKRKPA